MSDLKRILSIEIIELFGWFNHYIHLHENERITIIHGPNGVGKTTILRLLVALFGKNFLLLSKINFKSLEIVFTDNSKLKIIPMEGKNNQSYAFEVSFYGSDSKHYKQIVKSGMDEEVKHNFTFSIISDIIPHLERVGPNEWFDRSSRDVLTIEEVFIRYENILPPNFEIKNKYDPWLVKVLDSVKIHFIETQRLLLTRPRGSIAGRKPENTQLMRPAVEQYSEEMAERIRDVLRKSGTLAASLDRTFPNRLLKGSIPVGVKEDDIRNKYREQSEYRKRLMDAGLLETEEPVDLPSSNLDSAELRVLWYYLKDVDEKLAIYNELLERVELFKRIIDDKKFLKKGINVNKDGFIFFGNDQSSIPLNALSSGEQHEIVLTYELLFRATRNSLILIDEPELSLHVTWQHKFLDDMERISQLADLDFVVATHSSAIVRRRTALMVPLEGTKND
jgi:predicted ATP-binding protein involved in virulence